MSVEVGARHEVPAVWTSVLAALVAESTPTVGAVVPVVLLGWFSGTLLLLSVRDGLLVVHGDGGIAP